MRGMSETPVRVRVLVALYRRATDAKKLWYWYVRIRGGGGVDEGDGGK